MSVAARLKAGEMLFSAWSGLPDALTVEAVAQLGFDAVTLDMQHGGHHEDSVLRGIVPVLRAQKHPLVRIPVGRCDMASRALDFGAEGVIAPMVNSVDDARAFAAAMKYPPLGSRSWGPNFALPRSGQKDAQSYLRKANQATLAFAMIETRAALEAVEDIIAVAGIDGLFVGPSDFSIAWTGGEAINPTLDDMMEAIGMIAASAAKAGKFAGIYLADPALGPRYRAMGYRLMAMGNEGRYMAYGSESMLEKVRGHGV